MLTQFFAATTAFVALLGGATNAYSQSVSSAPPIPPTFPRFADSLLYHHSEPISLPEAYVEAGEQPWLFLRKSPNESLSVDWFQKKGLVFGSMYDGTYSASWIPNRRSTVAADLMRLLAVRGMPPGPWSRYDEAEIFAGGFFEKTETRARVVDLVTRLAPELTASEVTRNGALSVLYHSKNVDALPATHWAFVATEELHCAGLLIGD